ncbi:hypothetical protein KKG71_03880, partial [Patescibacteria group bacterium]|nr:hypothetical protein [Patescibacteria group bacterium]
MAIKNKGIKVLILTYLIPMIVTSFVPSYIEATEIGHTGSLIYPIENPTDSATTFEGVTLQIENAPVWFYIENTSLLGPIDIEPGEIYKFRVDFVVGSEFNQSNAKVEMDVKIIVANPSLSFTWHESSEDGLQTSKATCLDSSGKPCSMEIVEPDITPPVTSINYFWDVIAQPTQSIIGKNTQLEIATIDPDVKNSATSGVNFTGISIDQAPGTFSELQAFNNFFTLSEGPHTIYFASRDNTGNTEPIKSKVIYVDGNAPGKPENPAISGATWKNTREYTLTWTNPADVSGIAGVRVKFGGAAPASNDEGTFYKADNSLDYSAPDAVNGVNPIWLWLQDNVGNADPSTAVPLSLRYDDIPP